MAQVMALSSAPGPLSLSPDPDDSPESQAIAHSHSRPRPQPHPREPRIVSYAENRMSSYSKRSSRSRPHSHTGPPFPSSLAYAQVRDFAYPSYHQMHYGAPPEPPSSASTPPSDWNIGRRSSESVEGSTTTGRGSWVAGPWGDVGALYGEPSQDMEPLPSTAFGSAEHGWEADGLFRQNSQRKSKSFAETPNYERGRRRESGTRSADYSLFSGAQSQYDPAGRDALRQSRGFVAGDNGDYSRRDSHLYNTTTLPSRSFHTARVPVDPDEHMPLDAEPSTHSPQRESLGPEDEELFSGPSLALYSFEPENGVELRLVEGETIMVAYRHGQGWLVAENPRTGEQGLIPEQYVRLLRDIDGWDEEKGGFVEDDDEELGGDLETPRCENDDNSLPVRVAQRDMAKPGKHSDYDVAIDEMSQ